MSKQFLETPEWFKTLWAEFEKTHEVYQQETGYSVAWWKQANNDTKRKLIASLSKEQFKRMSSIIDYGNSIKAYAFQKYKYENPEIVGDADTLGVDEETKQLFKQNRVGEVKEMLGNFIDQIKDRFGADVKVDLAEIVRKE